MTIMKRVFPFQLINQYDLGESLNATITEVDESTGTIIQETSLRGEIEVG